ncbi:13443_t:CDS:2, partial [Cetraspora pellucida]
FLIISISTESNLHITPNTTTYTNFTYTESTQNTTFPQSQPYAIDIQFYDDGTTLIHLVRDDPNTNNTSHCLEPILRIRIIHLNRTVTEINKYLNIDPVVNYCLFNDTSTGKMMNPISIRPLKEPFILVSYVNTTNSSNYEDWVTVINWNGEKLSDVNGNLLRLNNDYYDSMVSIEVTIKFVNLTLFTSLATVDN